MMMTYLDLTIGEIIIAIVFTLIIATTVNTLIYYIYIYIYIERERESERERQTDRQRQRDRPHIS